MCGEEKSKDGEKTVSTPLVTVSDLQRLNKFEIIVLRRRLFPYKTRFQTNFEVDWGRKYPLASYPTREKREVQLFNIQDFVKEKKKEKMEAMGTFEPVGNPFSGSPFGGGNPFGGANPFAANPFGGGLPSFLNEAPQEKKDENSFNIDDLVKKIDAKIAEIEKEEEQTKETIVTEEKPVIEAKSEKIESPVIETEPKEIKTTVTEEPKPVAQTNDNNQINRMYEDNTDDDDFFDDFFADD